MKFSCDNCGAQYLIADTKLGERGVKVRCKKCSYVIILRPEGFVAEPKNGATKANGHDAHAEAPETADAETRHSIPNDATLPGEIVAATSSELGLSQEFMALGFDDDNAPVAPSRNMSLSVGLDVAQIDGGLAESHSSPFSSERTGGSLDYVTDRPSAQPSVVPAKPYGDDSTEILPGGGGLGHAQTREITAEEEEVATRVEAREDLEDEPTLARDAPDDVGGIDGVDDVAGFGDEATVGEHGADALLPPPESPADEPPVPVAYGVSEEDARADSFDAALGSALEREEHPTDEGDLDSEGVGETMQGEAPKWAIEAVNDALGSDGDINDDAALAALGVPPDPAESTPASRSDGLQDDFRADFDAGLSDDEANQFSTAFGDDATAGIDDDDDDGDAAALAALGASSDVVDEDSADISGALSSMQVNELADMKSSIAGELAGLGSELSAFGADASDEDPKTAVGPAPEMDEAREPEVSAAPEDHDDEGPLVDEGSVEDELGSAFAAMFDGDGPMDGGDDGMPDLASELAPSAGVPAETRVFDTDAMAQVQAEQEIAGRSQTREWYVAINDEQVGPLNLDELEAKWKTGEIDANTLSWRQGMADWTAIRFTEGLEPISALGAEKVPPVEEADAPEPSEMSQDGTPPQLAMEPQAPDEAPAASAPEPEPEAEDDDSGWKPSAASALASLAAEELASVPEPAPVSDVAAGPAIPAASTALEKLLEGENDGPGASMFGAAEKSESAVRPLPRRPDTVSSVPLRDPTIERGKKNYTIPAAILGGFLLLGVVLAGTIWMTSGSKPSEPVAAAPPPTDVAPPPVAPPPVVPAAGVAGATGPSGPTSPSGPTGPTGPTGPAEETTQVAAVTPPPAPPPTEVEEKKDDEEEPPPKKKRRRRRRRKVDDAPPPPPPPPSEPPPPPPTRRRTTSDDTADLLGAAPASRRRLPPPPPESDVPRQLDDSDVLGVLRKNAGAVRTCLKKQAAADPALDGTMTVKMVITRSGRTRRVSVSPDKFKSAVIGKCVSSSVKGWRFPKFSGPNMPIDFPVTVRGR